MKKKGSKGFGPETIFRLVGFAFFAYLFFGFMLLPCLNTLTSIFTTKNAPPGRWTPGRWSGFSLPVI